MLPLPWTAAAVVAVCPVLVGADSPADRDLPERLPEPDVTDPRVAVPTAYFKKYESLLLPSHAAAQVRKE